MHVSTEPQAALKRDADACGRVGSSALQHGLQWHCQTRYLHNPPGRCAIPPIRLICMGVLHGCVLSRTPFLLHLHRAAVSAEMHSDRWSLASGLGPT